MNTSNIIFIIGGAVLVFFFIKKLLQQRLITQYHPSDVATMMKRNQSIVLLDVRTQSERNNQHIKGSLHIPLSTLGKKANELERHKEKQIICYCQSGARSLSAAVLLQKHGFTTANLKGGIAGWNYWQLQERSRS
jgi:rhodanese-related sulfurtransferase